MDKAALDQRKLELERQFRDGLLAIVTARDLRPATISKAAGLNARFVTDLREGRAQAPKLANAYMLAEALGLDLSDIMAGRDRPAINAELLTLLAQYSPDMQVRLVEAVRALLPPPAR